MTQQIVPLFGSGNKARSKFVSAQRRLNCYVEQPSDPDKMQIVSYYSKPLAVYGRPGLKPYPITRTQLNGGPPQNGPWRGMIRGTYQSVLNDVTLLARTEALAYVESNQFWLYTTTTQLAFGCNDGDPTFGAPLMVTEQGNVQFSDNGQHFLAVDGVAGYVLNYNLSAAVPSNGVGRITAAAFPAGATSCAFLAGRFIVNDGMNPGRFWWSDLYDGSSWPGLNFATAESNPDPLNVVFESGGNLYLIGTSTTEFWAPQATGNAFARVGGSGIDWGTTATNSVRKYQGAVVMLARALGGARQVVLIQGYTPQVISTPDVENSINADPNPDGAVAVVTTINGHAFYVLNLTNTSWAFNGQTQTWDEWGTEGSRWAGNFIVPSFNGGQFVSDYRNDNLYTIEPDYLLDGTAAITREVITHHLLNNYERLTINKLTVDAEVGSTSIMQPYHPWAADFTQASSGGDTSEGAAAVGSAFTLEFKAKFLTSASGSLITWVDHFGAASPTWQVIFDSNLVRFQMPDNTAEVHAGLLTYDWQSFAVSFSQADQIQYIYVNGALITSANHSATAGGSSNGLLTIGDINQNFYMRDFRLWSYVRTPAQIAANLTTQFGADTPGLVALCNNLSNSADTFPNLGSNGGTFAFSSNTRFVEDTTQTYLGDPRSPQLMLQVSRDNGNSWGNELWQDMGQLGEYKTRTTWRRLGRARDFMFKLRVTDPVAIAFTGGAIAAQ